MTSHDTDTSQAQPRRTVKAFGWFLAGIGIAANPFTFGLLAPDGRIESPIYWGIIIAFEAVCIASGIYLIRGPRWSRVGDLAILGVTTAIVLLFCEQATRVYLFGADAFSFRAMNSMRPINQSGCYRLSGIPGLDYELKPSLDTIYHRAPLCTTRDGIRDDVIPVEKPEDTMRVAVLGDSFTFPLGVGMDDAFHTVLESKFEASYPGKNWEFINFSAPGYQLPDYLAILEHKAMQYGLDAVIIGFCAENDHQFFDWPQSFLNNIGDPAQGWPVFHSYLWVVLSRMNYVGFTGLDKTPSPEEREQMLKHFAAIRELTAPKDIPVLVAYLANIPRPADTIAPLVKESGLRFVDCSQQFSLETLPAHSTAHPYDSHPNARAQAKFADTIKPVLETALRVNIQ